MANQPPVPPAQSPVPLGQPPVPPGQLPASSNQELARPHWRNGSAYAGALTPPTVQDEIKKALLANDRCKFPRRTATPETDLAAYFTPLVKDLRLHDFGDWKYWGLMLGFSLVFLCIELFLVASVAHNTTTLLGFVHLIVISLVGLVILTSIYAFAALTLLSHPSLPGPFDKIPLGFFHAAPVLWVSLYTVGLNFYVVSQTGFSDSPFLHALLASCLVVMSLPRENSIPVYVVTAVALALGLTGAYRTTTVDAQALADWGGQELAKSIVLLTFVASAVSAFLLRFIANHRISETT